MQVSNMCDDGHYQTYTTAGAWKNILIVCETPTDCRLLLAALAITIEILEPLDISLLRSTGKLAMCSYSSKRVTIQPSDNTPCSLHMSSMFLSFRFITADAEINISTESHVDLASHPSLHPQWVIRAWQNRNVRDFHS